jgi:sugar lactone lactonase YvrE
LAVTLNGGSPVSLGNSNSFAWSNALTNGQAYSVTVSSQPAGATCTVSNGVGTITAASASNIVVNCVGGPLSVFAGNVGGQGNADGPGVNARFAWPVGMVVDQAGNTYVADSTNNTIRKITPAGLVSTFVGTAGVTGSNDGVGAAASFHSPNAIAIDGNGNLYVTDNGNYTIRKITPTGSVTTIAGTAGGQGSANGTGVVVGFQGPCGIATDIAGNVYVTDGNAIREITPAGVVSTFAGTVGTTGSADGSGSSASFNLPVGIAIDNQDNIYVSDTGNNTIRKITSAGVVSTIAGSAGQVGSADGTGAAARFNQPGEIAVDQAGNLYVADTNNYTIRKISASGTVTTLAGVVGQAGSADGAGPTARFGGCYYQNVPTSCFTYGPRGIAVDGTGDVLVADTGNNTIRKIFPSGNVATVAGLAAITGSADGSGIAASFNNPNGLAIDNQGNVIVADSLNFTIRKITPAGVVSTVAGSAGVPGSADGIGSAARFGAEPLAFGGVGGYFGPLGVATDAAGNSYIADSGNDAIRMITPAGVVTTLPGFVPKSEVFTDQFVNCHGGYCRPYASANAVTIDNSGNIYASSASHYDVFKYTPSGYISLAGYPMFSGYADGTGATAGFGTIGGMVTDAAGNIYVADWSAVRKVTPAGVVTTLAGNEQFGGGSADGTGSAARFNMLQGIAMDKATGNLYVADSRNNTVRKITPAGVVTTVVGVAGQIGFAAGALPGLLSSPQGVAISGNNLYISTANGIVVVNGLP